MCGQLQFKVLFVTTTIKKVKKAIKIIENTLPKQKALLIDNSDTNDLQEITKTFEKIYKKTIVQIAPVINQVASFVPRRRERVLHVGLFGYSRGVDGVKLPRAIGFTAALYSIGVPPELISTGRGIREIKKLGKLEILEKYYLNIKSDLLRSGKFLNKKVLAQLAEDSSAWKDVQEDVLEIENYLGQKLGPKTDYQREHAKRVEEIYENLSLNSNKVTELIRQAAILRRSLG